MSLLKIQFTKLSDERHRFAYARADGSGETVELETRSFLTHDLVHFAIESEAKLKDGFFGGLAAGKTYADLSGKGIAGKGMAADMPRETLQIEIVVGPMASVVQNNVEPTHFVSALKSYFAVQDMEVPAWLTAEFVSAVRERFRDLMGRWKATPFSETLYLIFQ